MNLVRVDRNGTKYYEGLVHCPRCGGSGGSQAWAFTGYTCYECGGAGRVHGRRKEYTQEYEAILAKKREERAAKELAKKEAEYDLTAAIWKEMNGFDEEGYTNVFIGDTYSIREELKASGAKYNGFIGWHGAKAHSTHKSIRLHIDSLCDKNVHRGYDWKNMDFAEYIKANSPKEEKAETKHVGKVGERIELELHLVNRFDFDSAFGAMSIYKLKDKEGNLFVWKTSAAMWDNTKDEPFKAGTVKATVKEHSEYKGELQTVLTRCKIA